MAVKNCPICGKVFNDNGGFEAVCANCKPEFDAEFDKVRDILYDHPEYNIVQVSDLTGLSVPRIKLYLREGRLIAVNNASSSLLSCVDCGKPIETGSYCSVCEYKHRASAPTGVYAGGHSSTKMHSRSDKNDKR